MNLLRIRKKANRYVPTYIELIENTKVSHPVECCVFFFLFNDTVPVL